ncbi:MAG: 50S ribosomal protein L23 [Crocinitomicaceae bacterium]|jgi:large subunit ribosomal protein L23|nr:50S ribosomal protein L23 [Crocinitomicaceae bacterium]MBT5401940.1 50S ribosomal protein L23 [Crocinitomicaceae bacterium]MBT6513958.1 50S ribosomal protein L23 [Crocinitomicaceae bacterium]
MSIIVKPIAQSEKAHMLQERRNQYSFIVEDSANKIEIAKAVAEMYKVEVEAVNTMRYGGGKKKMKNTTKGISYERNKTYKKAIVTLAAGDEIDFYSAI